MNDKYFEEGAEIEKNEEVKEAVRKEPKFEEELQAAVDQNSKQFYENVLTRANETILGLRDQVKTFNEQQIAFRDEVAMACYVPHVATVSDYKKAASDAFRAADAFLRIRESGDAIID